MAKEKFNIANYEFIDVSERSESGVENLSANELEEMVEATMEVLKATGGKMKKATQNLCLAAGVLGVRGGEFIKLVPAFVKYKKGNTSKEELKAIKKVFTTARIYYFISNFISIAADKGSIGIEGIYPYLARKK